MTRLIRHTTRYVFENPVIYALQKVRLHPLSGPTQTVRSWDLRIEGGRIEAGYKDHYGNHVDLVSADEGVHELTIIAEGAVETRETSGIYGPVYGRAPLWHFQQDTPQTASADAIADLAGIVPRAGGDILGGLHALSAAILAAVPYEAGHTDTATTASEAVMLGKGVCQDHSHIFISAARHAGIPARYVSGYLYMSDREEQEASHGWAEAHVDALGWVGFDVSNGVSPDPNYVRIAIGRDAQEATPITGMRIGTGDASMIVSLQVQQ